MQSRNDLNLEIFLISIYQEIMPALHSINLWCFCCITSICGAIMLPTHTLDVHLKVSLRQLTSIHSKQLARCCIQHQLIMVLQMFDFKGYGLANRLIVGSNDGGTISFNLQHQKKYAVIVMQASVLHIVHIID